MHNYGYLCFDYVIVVVVTIVWKDYNDHGNNRANYLKILEVVASQKVWKSKLIELRRLFEHSGMFGMVGRVESNAPLVYRIYFLQA